MKILMLPHISQFGKSQSGIRRVVEAYFKYLPKFGIELVDLNSGTYDLQVAHAGMGNGTSQVAHLHGLYWTADYDCSQWEYESNSTIINEIRHARQITVPSEWVAETFRRDMRLNPYIIGHGIEWQEWQHSEECENYVLWNKNRAGDVCSPNDMQHLARLAEDTHFVSTFGSPGTMVHIVGLQQHDKMKRLIQKAGVYLSTTKETFGIGVLEAMAAGTPVLGWDFGGNKDLIQHGVNGYLAIPNNFDDLLYGLRYCQQYRETLGKNGQELAKQWSWLNACEKVAQVYEKALQVEPPTVGVVIPIYNKTLEEVQRAIESCLNQTLKPSKICVVIDGGNVDYSELQVFSDNQSTIVKWVVQPNQGVAIARNNGIVRLDTKYICCLDSDDWMDRRFLEVCIKALENDNSLDIAYTGLYYHKPDGSEGLSPWPGQWNYDDQLKRKNQIPTCCVFRREMWQRLGGYKARYCPLGAGSEDAELWTRAGAYGFKAEQVTDEGLFHYSWLSGLTAKEGYNETDWLVYHPFVTDRQHPFASYATPANFSHPVRQYDQPLISVIIPVGPGHEKLVISALDSLEAQHFRNWEAIVVWDSDYTVGSLGIETEAVEQLLSAYPYIRFVSTSKKGAGFARNRGVDIARAPFLLFLDADDELKTGDSLNKLLDYWNRYQEGIYCDYVKDAIISEEYAKEMELANRLQSFNRKTGQAIITAQAYDFNLERVLAQPENNLNIYSWQLITCLFPTAWHYEIGGFDEAMTTWEDWDYLIRIVKAGHRFKRLPEMLLRYRMSTSTRRYIASADTDESRQMAERTMQYMIEKHKGIPIIR